VVAVSFYPLAQRAIRHESPWTSSSGFPSRSTPPPPISPRERRISELRSTHGGLMGVLRFCTPENAGKAPARTVEFSTRRSVGWVGRAETGDPFVQQNLEARSLWTPQPTHLQITPRQAPNCNRPAMRPLLPPRSHPPRVDYPLAQRAIRHESPWTSSSGFPSRSTPPAWSSAPGLYRGHCLPPDRPGTNELCGSIAFATFGSDAGDWLPILNESSLAL
jgi:hypothetical protein